MLLSLVIKSLKTFQEAGGFYSSAKDKSLTCLLSEELLSTQEFIRKTLIIKPKSCW